MDQVTMRSGNVAGRAGEPTNVDRRQAELIQKRVWCHRSAGLGPRRADHHRHVTPHMIT
jgi:hypothetical protein